VRGEGASTSSFSWSGTPKWSSVRVKLGGDLVELVGRDLQVAMRLFQAEMRAARLVAA
jgi:hypothetical protein